MIAKAFGKFNWLVVLCISLAFSPVAHADQNAKTLKEEIDEMMADLPPESDYHNWLIENGPVFGNYCGPNHGDPTYEVPCLSRMDCICKAHDFGSSVRHFTETAKGKVDKDGKLHRKVEEIKGERLRFAERAVEMHEIEEIHTKSMSVSIQPLNIFEGLFSLAFERRISRVISLQLGASFLSEGLITDTYLGFGNGKDFSAFLSVGVKGFVVGETLSSGIYIEPLVDFGYENIINTLRPTRENVRDVAFVPALMVGAEKTFQSGIQLDAGIGIGMHLGIPLSDIPPGFSTHFVVPKFRASVGYAW